MHISSKNDRQGAMKRAQHIIDTARNAGRDLTSTEQAETQTLIDAIKAYDQTSQGPDVLEQIKGLFTGQQGGEQETFDGTQVKDGLTRAIRAKGSYGFNMPLLRKAAITAGALDPALPAVGTDTHQAPPGASVVALRDLLTPQEAEAGTVRYYQLGAGSGADIVAEGGEKPELAASITPVDGDLVKLAVRWTYTDELAQDAAFLVDYIGREATRAVLLRENELIVDAFNTVSGALEAEGDEGDVIDILAAAIGAAEAANGITPTRIVANPVDVANLRTLKASGSGEYAVDPLSTAPASVHGVPLVPTPAVDAGSMYVISPGVGVFYQRGQLRVETGFTGDDWIHNRVTTRVEERVLPAIVQPTLLTRVTLDGS